MRQLGPSISGVDRWRVFPALTLCGLLAAASSAQSAQTAPLANSAPPVQHPCDVVVDARSVPELPALHAASPAARVDGPPVFLVVGRHAEMEAALCAAEVRPLLAGHAMCVSVPESATGVPRAGTAPMIALRGTRPVAVYWEGSVRDWVAGVVGEETNELELPSITADPPGSAGHTLAKMVGFAARAATEPDALTGLIGEVQRTADQWGRYFGVMSLLASTGDTAGALAAVQHAWDVSRGSLTMYGVRCSYLLTAWRTMLAADPVATRAALEAQLQRTLADGDAHPGDAMVFRDQLSLCELLGRPDEFAKQVRRHVEDNPSATAVFDLARSEGFDVLCEAGRFDAARLLVGPQVAHFLHQRLDELDALEGAGDSLTPSTTAATPTKASTPATATTPTQSTPAARELLGRRAMRVALLAGKDGEDEAAAVASQLRKRLGARGLLAAVQACADAGPPSEYGKRWGRQLLGDPAVAAQLTESERSAVQSWLGA